MLKPEDLFERSLLRFVSKASGRTVTVIALLLYPGVGLALPLGLGWPKALLVEANLVGTTLAAVVTIGWLMVRIEAGDRRHLLEWTTNLRLLDSSEFEWLVGEVFRREGWTVEETGRRDGPDGNIDLELGSSGTRKVVQCKRWTSWQVGVDEVRRFLGTLLREGLPAEAGIFVTLSNFSPAARQEAREAGLVLIDNVELHERIEKVRRPEKCKQCGEAMVLDRSQHGWWLRCVRKGCSGKRDLGRDPARAIELMVEPR